MARATQADGRRRRLRSAHAAGGPHRRSAPWRQPPPRARAATPPRKTRRGSKRRSGFGRLILLGRGAGAVGRDRGHRRAGLDRHPSAADPVAGNSQAAALGPDPRRQRRDARHPRRHGRRGGAARRIARLRAQRLHRHRGSPLLFALRHRSHGAFSRAGVADVLHRGVSEGGSTITQQLAKNLFLTQERTVSRKLQEIVLALWLEHKFSKAQILDLYLNRVYFGSGAYGVEAAAQRYFGKSARQLTLPEAAMLAGLVQSPSRLAPNHNPDGAERRAALVIADMAELENDQRERGEARAGASGARDQTGRRRLGQLRRRLGDGRGQRPRRQDRSGYRRRDHDRSDAAKRGRAGFGRHAQRRRATSSTSAKARWWR